MKLYHMDKIWAIILTTMDNIWKNVGNHHGQTYMEHMRNICTVLWKHMDKCGHIYPIIIGFLFNGCYNYLRTCLSLFACEALELSIKSLDLFIK